MKGFLLLLTCRTECWGWVLLEGVCLGSQVAHPGLHLVYAQSLKLQQLLEWVRPRRGGMGSLGPGQP